MMITYIEREDLDVAKYNSCIEHSINSKIYAYSWYLDIVADNWGILIYGDYQYVQPLPWRKKYGIKYIYPPEWTQQLGVFSAKKISQNLLESFLRSIPRKFKKVTIHFNSENFNDIFEKKKNYFLPLNNEYKEIFKGYSTIRKRNLNQFDSGAINIKESEVFNDIIELFISQKKDIVHISSSGYDKLNKLVSYLIQEKNIRIVKAFNDNEELIGGAIFIIDNYRIYYLFSAINKEGSEMKVMTKIIDLIISNYSNSKFILDFEGSMVQGIERFFKSFGAIKEEYYTYKFYTIL